MLFKRFISTALLATVLLTGCAGTYNQHYSGGDTMISAEKVEKYIIPGQTTLSELREFMGTPVLTGTLANGKNFVGFLFIGKRSDGEAIGRGVASILTFGIASENEKRGTAKSFFFVLDDNNVVEDIKYKGTVYLSRYELLLQYEKAVRPLTDTEMRDNKNYSKDYIKQTYKPYMLEAKPKVAVDTAAKKGKKLEELDWDDVFYPAYTDPGRLAADAKELLGEYSNATLSAIHGKQPNDGKKMDLILGTVKTK